jgi:hypothetical protein
MRRSKAEPVDVLLELAQADRAVLRQLTARLAVAAPADKLVTATRQAIADATDFDARDSNRNFDDDYEAYREVKRNLARLIDAGQLHLAMQLSDEGMMTEDIEGYLEGKRAVNHVGGGLSTRAALAGGAGRLRLHAAAGITSSC